MGKTRRYRQKEGRKEGNHVPTEGQKEVTRYRWEQGREGFPKGSETLLVLQRQETRGHTSIPTSKTNPGTHSTHFRDPDRGGTIRWNEQNLTKNMTKKTFLVGNFVQKPCVSRWFA